MSGMSDILGIHRRPLMAPRANALDEGNSLSGW
jgi:hypothetical protein